MLGKRESSNLVLLQDCFGSSWSLTFPCDREDQRSHFCKKGSWDFDRDFPESRSITDQFEENCHLNKIKSSSCEQGMPFHPPKYFISFSDVLWSSAYKSCTSF